MNVIIEFANAVFKPIIDLGAAPLMTVILTIIALCFRVKFTKALEGGIKLGIALTLVLVPSSTFCLLLFLER